MTDEERLLGGGRARQPNDWSSDSLWRHYSDLLNVALLSRWMPTHPVDSLLKTDLFDEATTDGLHPFLILCAKRVIAIDVSFPIVGAARLRHSQLQAVETDVRHLPFSDSTFDVIVSNSTLDHFRSKEEISISLRELYRVLRPKGELILTLDNLANPLIAVRNALPFSWLSRLGILPYYVGVTCRPRGLCILLEQVGFKFLHLDTVMHCPRVLAVLTARWMQKYSTPSTQRHFLRFLMAFEFLSRLPTCFLTGHFIAAKVIK